MNVWGTATLDEQRLQAPWGSAWLRRRRRAPASTPSPTTSPATGAFVGNQSQDGRSHHKAGEWMSAAPPTFSGDRLDGTWISAAQKHLSRWAPHGSEPSAGPLGQREPPDVSSRPLSCRAQLPAAGVMTTLQRRGAATRRTTPTCCSSQPPCWPLHDGSGDGSSSEETPSSPAFCLFVQLSL
jgi:hypothetical protein